MILESIRGRRSIRKYVTTPVTKEQTEMLLEAAMLSPSACNTRPWRFLAISNREMLSRLAEVHPHAKMLTTAALCIVVIALPHTQEGMRDGLAVGFYPQDCGAATQNILLQAEHMGLGSCWCGVYPKENTSKVVSEVLADYLTPSDVVFSLIAIGEKDESPNQRGRYEAEKVTWLA